MRRYSLKRSRNMLKQLIGMSFDEWGNCTPPHWEETLNICHGDESWRNKDYSNWPKELVS